MKNASINSARTEWGERKLLIFGACFCANFRIELELLESRHQELLSHRQQLGSMQLGELL